MKKADCVKNKLRFLILVVPFLILGLTSFLIISRFREKRGVKK